MAKNPKTRGNSQELEFLTTFLNLQLGQAGKSSIMADWIGPRVAFHGASAEAEAFSKKHNLYVLSQITEVQNDLRPTLQVLVAPETIIPIRAHREVRENIKHDLIYKYFSDPVPHLKKLLSLMSKAAVTSRWRLEQTSGKRANLHVRGTQWLLGKTEFLAKDKVYSWLARVLERDELSKLSCCRTCRKFFIRNRDWQKDCSEKCKNTYDNILSAERKAAQAKSRAIATRKRELYGLLSSFDFRRRLPGRGMQTQARKQASLIQMFDLAPSVNAFLKECEEREPTVRRIIGKMMQG